MGRWGRILAVLLAVVVTMGSASMALAGQSVVTSADLDRAMLARQDADAASRATIRALLARDEVKAIARDAGLDLRRADAAVATLDGAELQGLAAQAQAANAALAGGDPVIQISLVAALLIVIIVILLVR